MFELADINLRISTLLSNVSDVEPRVINFLMVDAARSCEYED